MRTVFTGLAAAATIVSAAVLTATMHGSAVVRPAVHASPVAAVATTRSAASAPSSAVPKPRRSVGRTAPAAPVERSPVRGAKVIFLTFDDGPDPVWTPQILRVLTDNGATATFFDIGQNAVGRAALIRQIRAQGSHVGNHTWNHPSLPTLTDAAITQQLDDTDRVQGRARCVRPPYGATDNRVDALIRARGQRVELWNVDTRDWARPGVPAIEHQLLTARAGSTVLMHTGGGDRSQTVAALRAALPKLRAAGYVLQGIPGC